MCRSDSFCFFKQKTAYAMRISDWSSDVCSSDLPIPEQRITTIIPEPGRQSAEIDIRSALPESEQGNEKGNDSPQQNCADHAQANRPGTTLRSEEHTSELQSLTRIPYAVFCLQIITLNPLLKPQSTLITAYTHSSI